MWRSESPKGKKPTPRGQQGQKVPTRGYNGKDKGDLTQQWSSSYMHCRGYLRMETRGNSP
ncbi:hypothetical protein V6R21_07615 [Limibacter armeniacum]|uniref:hypothetical protein n=1 Tax=Limibacter armeniacum TaxID=466084 RepID=UPI002FE63005